MTDRSLLGKAECCIGSRLTGRTLRVSPGKPFLAEQAMASSGSVEASEADSVKDLLGLATPTASPSIIVRVLEP